MNKTISLFMMVFLLVGTLSIVAAEESDNAIPQPQKVGFFQNQMFKLNLAFTFNKEKKIQKTLDMAEKRLAEAELLAEEDPEAYKEAQDRYDELVAKAEETLNAIESKDGDMNDSVEYLEKIARIQNKFERHRDHADEIYARAFEKLQANNASDDKIARFEEFHERALNKSNIMEERALEKRDNAIRKYKALSEMNDEELGKLLGKIDNDEGLTKAREARKEQAEKRFEKFQEIGAQRIEKRQEHLENAANLTEMQRQQVKERLEMQKGQIEESGNRIQQRIENMAEMQEQETENAKEAIKDELESRNSEDSYPEASHLENNKAA